MVETQKPLDSRLTKAAPEPAAPAARCVVAGFKVPCNKAIADYIDALRAWGRGMHKQLGEIDALQPKKEPQ